MKIQTDKIIDSGGGEIKKILMSTKSYKIFFKEVFGDTPTQSEDNINEKMSCIYRGVEIEANDMFVLNIK